REHARPEPEMRLYPGPGTLLRLCDRLGLRKQGPDHLLRFFGREDLAQVPLEVVGRVTENALVENVGLDVKRVKPKGVSDQEQAIVIVVEQGSDQEELVSETLIFVTLAMLARGDVAQHLPSGLLPDQLCLVMQNLD